MPEYSGLYKSKEEVRSHDVVSLMQKKSAVDLVNFVDDVHFFKLDLAAGAHGGALGNLFVADRLAHFETNLSIVFALATEV